MVAFVASVTSKFPSALLFSVVDWIGDGWYWQMIFFLWWCFRIYIGNEYRILFNTRANVMVRYSYASEHVYPAMMWAGRWIDSKYTKQTSRVNRAELAAIFHVMFFHNRLSLFLLLPHNNEWECWARVSISFWSRRQNDKTIDWARGFWHFFSFVLYAYVSHCFPNAICRRLRLTQYFLYFHFMTENKIKIPLGNEVRRGGGKSFMLSEGKNYAHILCFYHQRLRLCCQRL